MAILLCCVVGRGAYVLYLVHATPEVTVEGDTHTYTEPARALLDDGRFNTAPGSAEPEFLRTPGYPAFIAAVSRVFGDRATAVLLAQVALSGLTVLLVYLLTARMWSPATGLLAALLTTLDPLQNYSAATLVTESVGALLLVAVAGAGFLAFAQEKPRLRMLALLGLTLAVATMVRPVTYYLPLFVIALLAYRFLRMPDARAYVVKMLVSFLIPLVVIVGGWQLRNHQRVDSWRLSGVEAKNMYQFRAAGVIAEEEHLDFETARQRLRQQLRPIPGQPQGAYYGRMYREGVDILASHPLTTARVTFEGLGSELFSVRFKFFNFIGFGPASGPVEWVALTLLLGFYAATGYGVVLALRRRGPVLAHVFVLGVAVYVLLASAGPEAFGGRGERFRAPIIPILILYAARGGQQLFARLRTRA